MRRYYIFITSNTAIRVPRKWYNLLTSKTRLSGIVELIVDEGEIYHLKPKPSEVSDD